MKSTFLFILVICTGLSAQNKYAAMTINDWVYWQSCDGISAVDPQRESGGIFPAGKAAVIYQDGTPWAGLVRDSRPGKISLRAGGQYYSTGTAPGWMETPGTMDQDPQPIDELNPRVRIYRVRSDFDTSSNAALIHDAAISFGVPESEVDEALIDALRKNYKQDWQEWPADLGAPYYDRNRNGQWDADFDEPGIAGADQVIWYVMHDMNEVRTQQLFDSPPMGLEVQVTVWAYKGQPHVGGQVIYKRYRLINKSAFTIDSMYFGQFSDADIGDFTDDYVGCDSSRYMGYTYNGPDADKEYEKLDMPVPAVAYVVLQGPIVEHTGGRALQDFQFIENYTNIKMSSFWHFIYSSTLIFYQDLTQIIYCKLQGYAAGEFYRNPIPFYHYPCRSIPGKVTKFPLNGDPILLTGDLDGCYMPGERNLMINTGPFSMQPGGMQEIVIGVLGGKGIENTRNALAVFDLQYKAPYVHWLYQDMVNFEAPVGARDTVKQSGPDPGPQRFYLGQNYPNPFNSRTHLNIEIPNEMVVDLAIYNVLGQRIKTIYRGTLGQGVYPFEWRGENVSGSQAAGGIYFMRLSGDGITQVRKMAYLP